MKRLLAVLAAATLCGCSVLSPQPDLSRNFLLTEQIQVATPRAGAPSLAVGPITLPAYLDRSEMVVRVEPNKVGLLPLDRWAEPLQENFSRVFVANLAAATGTNSPLVLPWLGRPTVDYRVTVAVEQFEQRSDAMAVLIARWQLREGIDGAEIRSARSRHEVHIDGAETGDAVAALSRAVALLAEEIAAAIPR